MIGVVRTTALLTGVFCVGFSVFVALLTEALNFWQVLIVSFLSGFCGSVFAQCVIQRGARRDG